MNGSNEDNPAVDASGEVSLSIEETNKLRASLGLPPLKVSSNSQKAANEEHKKRKRDEEDAAQTAELEERVRRARERRRQQEVLDKTQPLAAEAPDVDDVMAWVNKSRTVEQQIPAEEKHLRKLPKKIATASVSDDEDAETGTHRDKNGAALLAGMKVKLGAEELEAGEEMILTLEDRGILDEKGQLLDDEEEGAVLENVLVREVKQRAKAFRDAKKSAAPLWEEDGIRRSMLDKYDEEEEEALQLDDVGAIETSKLKRQDDIRAKLADALAAGGGLSKQNIADSIVGGDSARPVGGDYYTPEEMEAMRRPRKKKERRLKKKTLAAEELAALEEAAAGTAEGDLGSRAHRERRAAERATGAVISEIERRSRFEAALDKANVASEALKQPARDALDAEDEDDLHRSLNKAREFAAKKMQPQGSTGPESIAAELARRRREETSSRMALGSETGRLTFTDIGEFTRAISVKERQIDATTNASEEPVPPVRQQPIAAEADEVEPMEEGNVEDSTGMEATTHLVEDKSDALQGGWMPATKEEGFAEAVPRSVVVEEQQRPQPRRNYRRRQEQEGSMSSKTTIKTATEAESVGNERAIGSGLAGALAFLKDRGELGRSVEWAGRTNDSRDSYFTRAMGGYKDVYTGGRTEDRLALDVEVALTRKDEHGRVLTPKEAFRQLCHQFHGIKPSKNTQEKRAKQVEKELAQRRVATGAAEVGVLAGLKAAQEASAAPYVALSGTVRPGQSRDAASGYATVDLAESSKLGGKKSMPPPPPRTKN